MTTSVGLDWAGKGWFGVVLEDDAEPRTERPGTGVTPEFAFETAVFPTILSVWHEHADAGRIFVDIPIGLPETGRRACDVLAGERLGDRRRSVFFTPCRDAVYEPTFASATAVNESRTGHRLSTQTWAIVPRIREVDEFLAAFPPAIETVRESHPELCFWAFAGEPMAHAKTTEAGRRERLAVLGSVSPSAETIYRAAVETHIDPPPYARTLSKTATADVLDALALALAARGPIEEICTLPADPPRDARGIPMAIAYRTPGDAC